jgi:hypothetical protein
MPTAAAAAVTVAAAGRDAFCLPTGRSADAVEDATDHGNQEQHTGPARSRAFVAVAVCAACARRIYTTFRP